jgi:hypothetical protein
MCVDGRWRWTQVGGGGSRSDHLRSPQSEVAKSYYWRMGVPF